MLCPPKQLNAAILGRRERRGVIEQIGRELLEPNEQGLEQVEGHRVVELLATMPIEPLEEPSKADTPGSSQAVRHRNLNIVPLCLCPSPPSLACWGRLQAVRCSQRSPS